MDFGEALARFAQTKPSELEESVERSNRLSLLRETKGKNGA
jgi:hypothetical protein